MKTERVFHLTREKHLDHMVRVVPFITFCYFVHAYVIHQMAPSEFSFNGLVILGGLLALKITALLTYDLKHQVTFYENEVHISFLGRHKRIPYSEILELEIKDPDQSFSHLILHTPQGKHHIYFVDDARKIEEFVNQPAEEFDQAA